MAVHFDG